MTTKTAEMYGRIGKHGRALVTAFPDSPHAGDPVKLCKLLRRVECAENRRACQECNGEVNSDDAKDEAALAKVRHLLGISEEKGREIGLFLNGDPRGYTLKLSDDWVRGYNSALDDGTLRLQTDWGGYGILAPDLT
jgi:hypothetical protein